MNKNYIFSHKKVSASSKLSEIKLAELMFQKKSTIEEIMPKTTNKIDPKSAEVHKNEGIALIGIKKYEEAISSFEKSIQINNNDYVVHNSKGFALNQLNKVNLFFSLKKKKLYLIIFIILI
jgi:Flp pilus assembly protein TadD